jgi:hypothetical protein
MIPHRIVEMIIVRCQAEIQSDESTAATALAEEILEALGIIDEELSSDVECECNADPVSIEDMVRDYVKREGDCTPDQVILLSADECPVYKVTVTEFNENWIVPTPEFWYVCTYPAMNLYRSDHSPHYPWSEETRENDMVDYLKTFHTGMIARVMSRIEQEEVN